MRMRFLLLGLLLVAAALLVVGAGVEAAGPPSIAPVCLARSFQDGPAAEPLATTKIFFPLQASPCNREFQVPFDQDWMGSGHADKTAVAFTYWNAAGSIPTSCAKCHSTHGYRDFLGADGTAEGVVDNPAPTGSTVECVACHNDKTLHKTSVKFPSGVTIENLGDESRCMECHQGRESGPTVDAYIAGRPIMAADVDAVDSGAGFRNIHYFAAAATQYGTMTKGGYEYPGKRYDVKFAHVEGVDTCYTCHNMHTLEVKFEACVDCHPGVEDEEDVAAIRTNGSLRDYDGDGNVAEGVSEELAGMQAMLLGAIKQYAQQVSLKCIVYDPAHHPYWFNDADCNGVVDAPVPPATNSNYNAFTARLMKATYNYQVAYKDGGKFAHGGKYIIELLYDSIADLNPKISTPVDLSKAVRADAGHFNSSSNVWRRWDTANAPGTGEVEADCARCHSAEGVPLIVKETDEDTGLPPVIVTDGNHYPLSIKQPVSSGLMCTTCHKTLGPDWELLEVPLAVFPSGAALSFADAADKESNVCLVCHQGEESTVSVNERIGATADDAQLPTQGFINIHYRSAGSTLFGTEAKGMYEFAGKTYRGVFNHTFPAGQPQNNSCAECHGAHELKAPTCVGCHGAIATVDDLRNINFSNVDWDHNGTVEGLKKEIDGLGALLYADMRTYAATTVGTPIVFASGRFYVDVDGDGVRDPEDSVQYNKWTPRLLRAGYNYNYLYREIGAYGHNGKYAVQVLYDSLESFGHNMTGFPARP